MKRWERLEDYLFTYDLTGRSFTAHGYATHQDISTPDASADIRSYLAAQRSKKSRTLYVLKREPGTRTTTARWSVGQRTVDIRAITAAFADDIKRKFVVATAPDVRRIAVLNPRAGRRAEMTISAIADGAIKVLEAAVFGGIEIPEQEEFVS